MGQIGIGIIGCGGITLQNHLPGLALCQDTKVVALCDNNPATLKTACDQTGISIASTNWEDIVARDEVTAVIIATPNFVHAPITIAAARAGKHVLCEKPIAMSHAEAVEMVGVCEAAKVRHMTAFTYRFVPAFRYLQHLVQQGAVGQPYHFRVQRFQDWGTRNIGWRQVAKLAGSGELGDMLSHRLDYAHLLMGPVQSLVADMIRFHDVREGHRSDLEDWVSILAHFTTGATGVMESSKVCTGRGESMYSHDFCEVNGSEGSVVYSFGIKPEVQVGKLGDKTLTTREIPKEFLKWPGSPRDPSVGNPLFTFRYDQNFEFIDAIHNQRPCVPSLADGARAQAVMDAAKTSAAGRQWVDLPAYW